MRTTVGDFRRVPDETRYGYPFAADHCRVVCANTRRAPPRRPHRIDAGAAALQNAADEFVDQMWVGSAVMALHRKRLASARIVVGGQAKPRDLGRKQVGSVTWLDALLGGDAPSTAGRGGAKLE